MFVQKISATEQNYNIEYQYLLEVKTGIGGVGTPAKGKPLTHLWYSLTIKTYLHTIISQNLSLNSSKPVLAPIHTTPAFQSDSAFILHLGYFVGFCQRNCNYSTILHSYIVVSPWFHLQYVPQHPHNMGPLCFCHQTFRHIKNL